MRHARLDYEAIQPWPTKRPHHMRFVAGQGEPVIPDDEPVFVLRAKDRSAPDLVRLWAEVNAHDSHVAGKVKAWADEMERYANEHYAGGKAPDTPHELLR